VHEAADQGSLPYVAWLATLLFAARGAASDGHFFTAFGKRLITSLLVNQIARHPTTAVDGGHPPDLEAAADGGHPRDLEASPSLHRDEGCAVA
jgi:hypothetical protein